MLTQKQTSMAIQRWRLQDAYRTVKNKDKDLTELIETLVRLPASALAETSFINQYRVAAAAVNRLKPAQKVWTPTVKYRG